jgi:hypothetical protein
VFGLFILFPGIQRYAELMRFDSGCACGSLQSLRNFGHANILFREPLKFINIGGSPRTQFYSLLSHFDSGFGEAASYHADRCWQHTKRYKNTFDEDLENNVRRGFLDPAFSGLKCAEKSAYFKGQAAILTLDFRLKRNANFSMIASGS